MYWENPMIEYSKSIIRHMLCWCAFSLQPKNGGRLQPSEYTQTAIRMRSARFRDNTPMEARGRVMTTYRSMAITVSVIMEQIPKRAPQKAYSSQPAERERIDHFLLQTNSQNKLTSPIFPQETRHFIKKHQTVALHTETQTRFIWAEVWMKRRPLRF